MRSAVETGTAGKQAVAVCDLANIFFGTACGNDGTGAAVFPQINILLGVEGHNAATGCAGGGLDADTILQGLCQKSVRVGIPQIRLGEEGELVQVLNAVDVFGLHAFFVHQITVIGHIFVDMFDLFDQFFRLKLFDFFNGQGLDFFLVVAFHCFISPLCIMWGT